MINFCLATCQECINIINLIRCTDKISQQIWSGQWPWHQTPYKNRDSEWLKLKNTKNVILNDDVITVCGYLWVTDTCIWCTVALATLLFCCCFIYVALVVKCCWRSVVHCFGVFVCCINLVSAFALVCTIMKAACLECVMGSPYSVRPLHPIKFQCDWPLKAAQNHTFQILERHMSKSFKPRSTFSIMKVHVHSLTVLLYTGWH